MIKEENTKKEVTNDEISMKQVCEKIIKADFLTKQDGTKPTVKEIFNYSPTGELFMIFEWYKQAQEILKNR